MSADDVAGETYKRKQRARAADRATDDRPAIERLYSAYRDLLAQGWTDQFSIPKDGSEIEIIEMGSTGIFKACWHSFGHADCPDYGCFFAADGGQHYPSKPVLWRRIKPKANPQADSQADQ